MTYYDKVKASREVYKAIKALEDDMELGIVYGSSKDYTMAKDGTRKTIWKDNTYSVRCTNYGGLQKSYSLSEQTFLSKQMNVDKLTKTTMSLYTYDLMGTKTTYRLPLYEVKLIKQEV